MLITDANIILKINMIKITLIMTDIQKIIKEININIIMIIEIIIIHLLLPFIIIKIKATHFYINPIIIQKVLNLLTK